MAHGLIVLEGLDGSGKSTLAAAVAEALDAVCLATPPTAVRGVRGVLDHAFPRSSPSATLFYAAGALEASREAALHLARGRHVAIDRYWLSTRAYARVLGHDLELPEVEALLVPARLTVFVEVPRAVRAQRLVQRGRTLPHDALTLEPTIDRALSEAFDALLDRPIAGEVVRLDGTRSLAELVSTLCRRLA